jgi:hypothetical protein
LALRAKKKRRKKPSSSRPATNGRRIHFGKTTCGCCLPRDERRRDIWRCRQGRNLDAVAPAWFLLHMQVFLLSYRPCSFCVLFLLLLRRCTSNNSHSPTQASPSTSHRRAVTSSHASKRWPGGHGCKCKCKCKCMTKSLIIERPLQRGLCERRIRVQVTHMQTDTLIHHTGTHERTHTHTQSAWY